MKDDQSLIPAPNLEIILDSGVDSLLSMIRPHWQAKNLICIWGRTKTSHDFMNQVLKKEAVLSLILAFLRVKWQF